jgi:protein-tyrosine phosphatase
MKQILVVCTANICRSPLIAGILDEHLGANGLNDVVTVRSAGIYAQAGNPVWGPIGELMAERGIDLHRHRSQPITSEMALAADLIIVMEEGQRQSIFYLEPRALRKVVLLSELSGEAEPFSDLMGRPLPELAAACSRAEEWLITGWNQITSRLDILGVMKEELDSA